MKTPAEWGTRSRAVRFDGLAAAAGLAALGILLAASGCGKSGSTATTSAPATAPAPAAPAAAPAAPAASAPPAAGSPGSDTTARLTAVDWALKQDSILHDPNGEWAISATSSSSYNDAQGPQAWSANQAAGAPNVPAYADDGHAWAPKTTDSGIEWLDLKYVKPVHATEVRVRESFNSGTIIKVDLIDSGGTTHTVWTGTDPTTGLNYLMVSFPKTDYKATEVKVTLATNLAQGWKEIDAVQLVGTDQ